MAFVGGAENCKAGVQKKRGGTIMEVEEAAVVIQAHFRGLQARKIYARKLLDMFENEDAICREKGRLQVWEGEMLIERYALQQSGDDDQTHCSNEQRRYNTMATRIQRAWRTYQHKQITLPSEEQDSLTSLSSAEDSSNPKSNTSSDKSTAVKTPNGHAYTAYGEFVNRDLAVYNGRASSNIATKEDVSASVENLARRVNSLVSLEVPEMEMFEELPDFDEPLSMVQNRMTEHEVQQLKPDAACQVTDMSSTLESNDQSNFTAKPLPIQTVIVTSRDDDDASSPVPKTETFISKPIQTPLADYCFTDQTHNNDVASNYLTQMSAMGFEYPESGIMAAHSEDKYRLLYTIDLSDSSQEDNHANDAIGLGPPEPAGNNDDAATPSIDQSSTVSSDTITNTVYPLTFSPDSEEQVLDTPMTFSEEFDIHFPAGSAAAISLAYNTPSAQPLTLTQVTRRRSRSVGSESSRGWTRLDHSKSPMHAMNNRELSLFLVSLERKLKGTSQSLVLLLQERETLKQENGLLHTNIAHFARRAQQLYTSNT